MPAGTADTARGPCSLKVAIVANSAWYLQNFRLALAQRLRDVGHSVVFIGPSDGHEHKLLQAGFAFCHWPLASAGTNPWTEGRSVLALHRILAAQQVEAVLSYTPKANIYSGIALRGRGLRYLPNVSGLGRAFIKPSPLLRPLVSVLYRLAFKPAGKVVFQNEDDRERFVAARIVERDRTLRVPGSGVDLQRFKPSEQPLPGQPLRFLFVGRLLRDKGVEEFVEAARRIRRDAPDTRFVMLGSSHSDNPAAISRERLQQWLDEGVVEHIEQLDDVRPQLGSAHCVVLPSYREGVPRSLLEAAAMAKPIVTTDAPGCRDTVIDGLTGYLCAPRSVAALETALRRMLALDAGERQAMGNQGRHFVEQHFDEGRVLETYVTLLDRR